MNLKNQRKKYYISVKKILLIWEKGGADSLIKLFSDSKNIIEKDSWVENIKKLLDQKELLKVNNEIYLILHKFNIDNYDEKKNTGRADNSPRRFTNKSKENIPNSISGNQFN